MRINKNHSTLANTFFLLAVLLVLGLIICCRAYTSDALQPKSQYKIIKPIYLMALYNSLNNKVISRETARAYLHAKRYYNKSIVAFQCEIPVGTTMTIAGLAPKVWYLPFLADRYFVQLNPDLSRGLDVVLQLDRGIEGGLDGLNPELFSRIEP